MAVGHAPRRVDRLDLPPSLQDHIHDIHNLALTDLPAVQAYASSVLADRADATLREYLTSLSPPDCARALQLCMLLYYASNRNLLPRVLQLRAALAALAGSDSVVKAGTAAGKTICMALVALMHPDTISIIVVPLKRLMANQVCYFTLYTARVSGFLPTRRLKGSVSMDFVLYTSTARPRMILRSGRYI